MTLKVRMPILVDDVAFLKRIQGVVQANLDHDHAVIIPKPMAKRLIRLIEIGTRSEW